MTRHVDLAFVAYLRNTLVYVSACLSRAASFRVDICGVGVVLYVKATHVTVILGLSKGTSLPTLRIGIRSTEACDCNADSLPSLLTPPQRFIGSPHRRLIESFRAGRGEEKAATFAWRSCYSASFAKRRRLCDAAVHSLSLSFWITVWNHEAEKSADTTTGELFICPALDLTISRADRMRHQRVPDAYRWAY